MAGNFTGIEMLKMTMSGAAIPALYAVYVPVLPIFVAIGLGVVLVHLAHYPARPITSIPPIRVVSMPGVGCAMFHKLAGVLRTPSPPKLGQLQ